MYHITPVLKELHGCLFHTASITNSWSSLTKPSTICPPYPTDLLILYQPPQSLRSTSAGLLSIPKAKLRSFGDRAFSVAAPKLLNSLPQNLHEPESLILFQSRLKTHLFNSVSISPSQPSSS
ncbi:hypothetical protein CesoFtcFv8_009361 [Champsocephalus esox]|uniref:Uncharacterized protein n=1 Tax=Champsocephalus esox TaxID=159716 RepID=A0AAN8CE87_9TELE|nr:hypothetical protein CesoFtcFv8_009361 [Champsocephalus esox]